VVSYRRRNHPCQILGRLVKGLGGYSYPKSGVSHWLWMSLLQTTVLRTNVLHCDVGSCRWISLAAASGAPVL